jgi:uncharacterized membrane protein YczE
MSINRKKVRDFLINVFIPNHHVPKTRWTADNLWDLSFGRVVFLTLGIVLLGIGSSLTVQSGLGNAPWTVLAQGISIQTGLTLGISFFLVSLVVLLLWIPLSLKPGYGTIANTVFFAFGLQIGIEYIPEPTNSLMAYLLVLAGVWTSGAGGALYITCGLGTGPRDGIMLGFLGKSKLPITVVRALIEIFVLLLGYLLGGLVGIGTIIIALLIGRSFSFWFNFYGKFPPKQTGVTT